MIRFIGILEKDPGSLWGIWFPDLPGCVSAAVTSDMTIEQATEALRLWVEDAIESGETLPRARSVEELRLDPDVLAALEKGDTAILVSMQEADDALPIDRPALAAIDAAAAKRGLTRLDFVREAVLDKIAS